MHIDDINWSIWVAGVNATLVFVIVDGRILLIHKKRGLGAGKINGPGGGIDPGEFPLQAAIREVQEELCVTPIGIEKCGELRFQFTAGLALHCHIFKASGCLGEPQETEEARPLWVALEQIPYDKMWADDRIWMPLMLAGKKFEGRFLFDGERLLAHEVHDQM